MTTTTEPRPSDRTMPKRRGRRWSVMIAAVVVLIPIGFLVGRSLWWSLRPTPSFRSLAQSPDPTLRGTVAYVAPFPNDNCVFVVAASGGTSKRIGCVRGAVSDLGWLPDGRLGGTRFERGPGATSTRRWIADVGRGTIEDVPNSAAPPKKEQPGKEGPESSPGPHGEHVATTSSRGRLIVTLKSDGLTRTLLSVGAPDTYTFGLPVWNGDGSYFVVKDDLDRLLVVTTAVPSRTRLLAERGWGQAVTDTELRDLTTSP